MPPSHDAFRTVTRALATVGTWRTDALSNRQSATGGVIFAGQIARATG